MTTTKLDGIRVLDMSRVFAGPLIGQMLADLGAEVIKVERPQGGDEARRYGPPFFGDESKGGTSFFLAANRNKSSVAVDFSKPEGAELVRQLALKCDVLIENFRVGTLARYGLDYETLSADHPGLIYCSLTGYGQEGPYAQRPGYDAIFQSMGGLMSSIGYPDDHPAAGPLRTGLSITDIITSLYGSIGITSALYARAHNGGRGDWIDLALMDSTVATMSHYAMHYLISGTMLPRRGNAGNGGVPSQAFQCIDGWVMITVGNDVQFERFCHALNVPELINDDRFARAVDRVRNRDALISILESVFIKFSKEACLDALIGADIPAGGINDIEQVFSDPQVIFRQIKASMTNNDGSHMSTIANPIRYQNQPIKDYCRPPLVGEHTHVLLAELLGYSADALESLVERGVIGAKTQDSDNYF